MLWKKSIIATNFRRWATERLKEYMIKGFTMDDERLKENGGGLRKLEFFKGSIKIINSSSRYFPDLYHIVLHIFILIALIFLNIYIFQVRKKKKQ